MKRPLFLRRLAQKEFDDATAWYEKQRVGLGTEFQIAIEHYFNLISENPAQFPKVRREVRGFPYVIHFLADESKVVVLSVFHTSRAVEKVKYRR